MENNKEHMICITEPLAVNQALDDFEETWQRASPVLQGDIEEMQKNHLKKCRQRVKEKEDRHQSQQASSSSGGAC